MKLSNFAVRRPVMVTMLVFMVIILGFVSLTNLSVDLYPDFNLPFVFVMTSYEGAGPEEIENLVTRPLEESIGTINGVNEMMSESMAGSSFIYVGMAWGTDMNHATLQVRDRIDFVKAFLPSDIGRSLVLQADPSMMPILEIGVTGADGDLAYLKNIIEDEIIDRLLRVDGVASVYTAGGLVREIQVLVEPARLNAYGLTMDQVVAALQSENLNFSSGRVLDGSGEYLVRTIGQFQSLEDIGNVVLNLPQGGHIYLKDLGLISDGHKDSAQITRINGEPSIGVYVVKQSQTNTVAVADKVKVELALIEEELPGNIKMNIGFDQSKFINQSISSVVQNAVIGGLLAILVLFLFLRNVRSTSIIATAIPISIIATFTLIYFNNMTLNMMTLGGIALGIGMVVDSSIVILENIFRYNQQGYSRIEAAKQGAAEVGPAVIASTLTTLSVFLPIVFVQGLAAELFTDLALTVSFALAMSLLTALTLVPMLASKLLLVNGGQKPVQGLVKTSTNPFKKGVGALGVFLEWLTNNYVQRLKWALGHRKTVIIVVSMLLVLSLLLIPNIGTSFLPNTDSGEISISIELAKGTVVTESDKLALKIEEYLETISEIASIFVAVGPSRDQVTGLGAIASERVNINIMLVDSDQRKRGVGLVADEIREYLAVIPGIDTSVRAIDSSMEMGRTLSPVEIKVKGPDLSVLEDLSFQIKEIVEQVPGTREVAVPLHEGGPEYKLTVNRDKAAQYGLSVSHVANSARTALDGRVATLYRTGETEVDVRVMYAESYKTINELLGSYVTSPAGIRVPLAAVVDIKADIGPGKVLREDQVRVSTVNAQILGRDLGSVMSDIEERINAEISLPRGYTVEFGGAMAEMVDAFSGLFLALGLAIVLVYMVMASQFESLMYPFVIMFTLPTTIIGVVIGLVITGREFNVATFMGVIMLVGIVVNNAIVLIDYVNVLRERGMERNEAIMSAGPIRLRPILMTTFTTVMALAPSAIGIGVGAELAAPMATAVVFGLLASTLFTLILIPVVYTLFDDLGIWIREKIGWKKLTGEINKS